MVHLTALTFEVEIKDALEVTVELHLKKQLKKRKLLLSWRHLF